ncbi:MAG: hypothetical protein AB8G96_15805 [Phycisphaerales bacterium]
MSVFRAKFARPSRDVPRRGVLVVCLCLGLLASGCDRGERGSSANNAPGSATGDAARGSVADKKMVYWPELVTFDDLALRAEGVARAGDAATVEGLRPKLVDAGRAVTAETIPANVVDRPQVEILVGDIASLVESLDADPATASTIVLGIHPATARLMMAAGMPHIHANEGPNGGYLQPLFGADRKQVGTVEVLLDGDTGRLQAWLTQGGRGGEPWRFPVDTRLELTLPLLDRSVTLVAMADVADETKTDGTTAAFTFSAEDGALPSWLMVDGFTAAAELRFADVTTASFVLRPRGQ